MDLASLKQKFQGEITTHESEIERYSHDASIFQIAPQAIVFPKNTKDIQELVRYVSKNHGFEQSLSLTPRGGGTDMTGGSVNDSLIVDLTRHLNHILDVGVDSATTEAGVMFREFEVRLAAKNRVMPAYPASKALAAVGGMVGNNAGGEKTFTYGQVTNFVEELEVVLADGEIYTIKPLTESQLERKIAQRDFEGDFYRQIFQLIKDNYRLLQKAKPTTSKNSAGYCLWDVWDGTTFDLTKLFVGSQGTLGIITKIKWRTVPIKRKNRLVIFYLNELSKLGQVVAHVSELRPESFELFDKLTLRLALKYLPEVTAKMPGSRLRVLWHFLPELFRLVTGRLPEITLMAEFAGEDETVVAAQAEAAADNIREHFNLRTHITHSQLETQKFWLIRRESYNLLRRHSASKVSAPFIEDVVVHPTQLPEFMPQLNAILFAYPDFTYTIAGHAGDANFHIIPLVDLSIPKHRQQILEISDKVNKLVLSYRGSITAEHNDGLVRGPFLKEMFGVEVFELFKKTKHIFDPLNIFNPHKKTNADLKFYADHLRHN